MLLQKSLDILQLWPQKGTLLRSLWYFSTNYSKILLHSAISDILIFSFVFIICSKQLSYDFKFQIILLKIVLYQTCTFVCIDKM